MVTRTRQSRYDRDASASLLIGGRQVSAVRKWGMADTLELLLLSVIALAACSGKDSTGPHSKAPSTLTTAVGPGVNGTPEPGNNSYQNGATISYRFQVDPGYEHL